MFSYKNITINDGQTKLDCTVNESNDAETDLNLNKNLGGNSRIASRKAGRST